MPEPALERLLSVLTLCLVVLTLVISLLAIRLHQFIRRVERLLPASQAALQQLQSALRQTNGVLTLCGEATRYIEAALRQGGHAITRVQQWFGGTTEAKAELRRNGRTRSRRRGR